MNIRILTVSVQDLEGEPDRRRLLNQEIQRIAPDLLILQKVVMTPQRNQLAELMAGTGLLATHQAEVMSYQPPSQGRNWGNAVASRWKHQVVEALDLRLHDVPDVPWCTLAAVVDLPGEGEVLFIGTTFAPHFNAAWAHERQSVAITELDARHRRALPTIIAGDFNAAPESACIRFLSGLQSLEGKSVWYHDTWAVRGEGPGYTFTSDNARVRQRAQRYVQQMPHRSRIDYVFVGSSVAHPNAHCQIKAANLVFDREISGVWLSDHFGVLVDVEIGSGEPEFGREA